MNKMTHAFVGILLLLCLILFITVATLIVVTIQLTGKEELTDKEDTTNRAGSLKLKNDVIDVAIVGAGISGSYAAWRMRNAGLSISLFEYSNRIGGRCHTVKFPGIPDVNIEMGSARFIPTDHLLLNKTIHDLGLDVVDYGPGYGGSDDTLYYLRGRRLKYNKLAMRAPYDLDPNHRIDPHILEWEIFKNYTNVDPGIEGYAVPPKSLFHKSKDGIPLYAQSRKSFYSKYFTSDTMQFIQDYGAWDADFIDVTAANLVPVPDPAQPHVYGPVRTVASGFQSIPETMVHRFLETSFKHTFHLNHHLRSIIKDPAGHFVLNFRPTRTIRGVTSEIKNSEITQVHARKVLLAIPRLALESLQWEALELPEIKDYIMNSLTEAKAGNMYFGYNDTWWRNLTLFSPYTISTTPLRQTIDYKESPSTGKGVLNPMYSDYYTKVWRDSRNQGHLVPGIGDDDSIVMTNIGVDMVRTIFADIFNITINEVKQPDFAVMEIWDQYPYGASWYTWRPRYIFEDVENKMMRPSPDTDVFIISNTFSKTMKSGWTEGALEIVERTFSKYFPDMK